LLPSGKVLVTGGYNISGNNPTNYWLSSAELYDPATGTWAMTATMLARRAYDTLTLLPNGNVLVAGGANTNGSLSSAELYDPITAAWKATGGMNLARQSHTATLLPNGQVLVMGGLGPTGTTNAAELYDPGTGKWTATVALSSARYAHTATLLPNGRVLLAGGQANGNPLRAAEWYDAGLGFSASWQPQIISVASSLALGSSLVITGSQFRGISGGAAGNVQDSPGDCPLVQIRNLESSQTMFLMNAPSTGWSTNLFVSAPLGNWPQGYALTSVFVNGIPSAAKLVNITSGVVTPITLTTVGVLSNGSFQFTFTNRPGASFSVLSTTNLSLSLGHWNQAGHAREGPPGKFQFTDARATNGPRCFYRVSSP
jgi:hypothetical protein